MECMDVLPPGFRFHPTDEELINDYLKKKVSTCSNPFVSIIADIDLYKFNPWDLPGKAYFGEKEWFFFSPRDRKYPNGTRPNRAAASGYWKATGTDKPILSRNSWCIGVKKALVFYEGRPPNGNKTNWMMYEYRLLDNSTNNHHNMRSMRLDDWVLCRVREKTGPQEPEPQPEDTKRKSKKAVYNDELEGLFMEEDENVHNISFAQNHAWPNSQQDYQSTHDRTMMLNFDERSSSSHSISYENMDHVHQLNENINGNQNLESMRRFMSHDGYDHQQLGPADHANKRLCSINSSTFLDNNSSIFQIFPI